MNFSVNKEQIRISLPITTPTGKVRIKRPIRGFASEPVACRSFSIQKNDYLEWQISYDTPNLNEPSVLKKIVVQKPQGIRYGFELIRLIYECRKIKLIEERTWLRLKKLVDSPLDAGIEETEKISRESKMQTKETISARFGFIRHVLSVPNYLKKAKKYEVEIKIAHKQRAVGNQAMIYVNLPLQFCEAQNNVSLIGRKAEKMEKVDYVIDQSNAQLIEDTVVAFAVSSCSHRDDLKLLFSKL